MNPTHPDPVSVACAELIEATAKIIESCDRLVKALEAEKAPSVVAMRPPPARWGEGSDLPPGIHRLTVDGRRVR